MNKSTLVAIEIMTAAKEEVRRCGRKSNKVHIWRRAGLTVGLNKSTGLSAPCSGPVWNKKLAVSRHSQARWSNIPSVTQLDLQMGAPIVTQATNRFFFSSPKPNPVVSLPQRNQAARIGFMELLWREERGGSCD